MHAANPFPTDRRASTAFARAFRAGGATGSRVQPSWVKPCCFHRAHGVADGSLRRERACPPLSIGNTPFSKLHCQ
jgi:hypothetical protein